MDLPQSLRPGERGRAPLHACSARGCASAATPARPRCAASASPAPSACTRFARCLTVPDTETAQRETELTTTGDTQQTQL